MKTEPRVLICLWCLFLLGASPALAVGFAKVGTFAFQWDSFSANARTEMLAGADLAAIAGPAAIWVNPAPLPEGPALQAGYHYFDYMADTDFNTLALSGEWRWLRVGVCRGWLGVDPMLVRTAYNPEGDGTTFDFSTRIWVLGASADVARLLFPHLPELQWSVGASYRNYHQELGDLESTEMTADDADLGTTARWRAWRSGNTWFGVNASLVFHNVFGASVDIEGLPAKLEQRAAWGGGLEGGLTYGDRGIDLQWLLSYAHVDGFDSSADWFPGIDRYGLELVFSRLLAFRGGHDTRRFGGTWSYGFGAIVSRPELQPFSLLFDYARSDLGYFDEWRNLWTITVRADL